MAPAQENAEDVIQTNVTPVYFDRDPDGGGPWVPTQHDETTKTPASANSV